MSPSARASSGRSTFERALRFSHLHLREPAMLLLPCADGILQRLKTQTVAG
ncbi:MAG: hypothetical protein M3071_24915 [Actinomycetota bacterium]|nr:hypothetical protein [Actinomycetota bacterium]